MSLCLVNVFVFCIVWLQGLWRVFVWMSKVVLCCGRPVFVFVFALEDPFLFLC